MRNHIDISLARFLMIVSMLLLGVLEYLWLNNEYQDAYRGMEDKLTQVMFTSMRDVEDSLIFSRLSAYPTYNYEDSNSAHKFRFIFSMGDSLKGAEDCPPEKILETARFKPSQRHQFRGKLLKELTTGIAGVDTPVKTLSEMVMHRIQLEDSTGEFAEYHLISWQGSDTTVGEAMSIPQFDISTDKNIALINPNYKADIFQGLIPHFGFAFFLWMMVGAAFYYIWKNLRKQIQLNALRDEFVGNITHELKTPITTAGVALESLNMSSELQSMQSRRYIDICQRELNRLSILVERILNNRVPQGHFEQMDVKAVLEEVMERMKVQFEDKHAAVDFRQVGEDFIILGDKTHMSGVFYNLIDNALKYGGKTPVIDVTLTRETRSIRLDIQDQGIGIAPVYHDKIFEKLYRVPQANRHDVKGHGLGLSYVSEVVNQHKGKISLHSALGKGSTFTMTLPAYLNPDNISETKKTADKINLDSIATSQLN